MAVIKCPECGHQVSDKAPVCPGCGVEIAGKVIRCHDCGEVYFAEQTMCPACHRPTPKAPSVERTLSAQVKQQTEKPGNEARQQVKPSAENVQQEEKKGKKSYTTIIVSFLVVVLLCGVFAYFYKEKVMQNEENRMYEKAMLSVNPLELQEYLNQYRGINQEHTDSINAHLAALMQIDTDWSNAVVSGTRDAIEMYIQQHPDSPHKGEALNKLDSMDFITAQKSNSLESYQKYLEQHPDGKYADQAKNEVDGMKSKIVQPEEAQMVKGIFKRFFQSVNSRNEDGMLATVASQLSSFLGKSAAEKSDVALFLRKIYKSDITNMNWHIIDDYTIDKRDIGNGEYEFDVKFTAEQNIERSDASQPKYNKYVITGVVDVEGKISQLNMTKSAE